MKTENGDITAVARVDDKDWFLEDLVGLVNSGEASFGITLNVGGFLVSGYLIGRKQYFDSFGNEFASMFKSPEDAESVKSSFAAYGDDTFNQSENGEPVPIGFLHLKDARFYSTSGNPLPGNRGVWWRGRLSEISGFSLGVFEQP
ncbi:hypothetical protein SAMN04487965_0869 [Microbulbifer donghaiensis]|uniref:Gas vesicle protein n=1 Tax=Microbulbifer donghaiensis TaxID=494016 RepID=A0A1M4X5N3_9GAMM|nr:gas vesicle accessory protein GvpU [Microbulbifer donghaiensis]SHE88736.1 hypothetical protein SAMN04487965_0869 [Microbulbifer donghaiensis]